MTYTPDNRDVIGILRAMAWERAKGELRSIEQTYIKEPERFGLFVKTLDEFIEKVESRGLHE